MDCSYAMNRNVQEGMIVITNYHTDKLFLYARIKPTVVQDKFML